MRTSRLGRYLKVLVGLGLVAGSLVFVGPQQLGGPAVYTVTTGNSMEPLLHEGDLAIVKRSPHYGTGDAVAYRSQELGRTVLHRIVGVEEDGYVFQGDNNDFLDPEHPGEDALLGTLWVHIPKVGYGFRFLQTPLGLGGVGVLLAALLGLFSVRTRRRRLVRPRHAAARPALPIHPVAVRHSPRPGVHVRKTVRLVAFGTLASMALSLVLGAVAYGAVPTRTESTSVAYRHSGTFSYTSPAPPGPAYDGPGIVTGEPVFLRLVDQVNLVFDYEFRSPAAHSVELDGQLDAVLGAPNGFVRTIELPTEEQAIGDELDLVAGLDLIKLKRLVHEVERSTGVEQGIYDLQITPEVSIEGAVADRPFSETFAPKMTLRFDGLQLLAPRDVNGEVPADVLKPSESGDIRVSQVVPGYLSAMGRRVSLSLAQRIAAIGALASLLVLLLAGIALKFVLPRDEASRIYARYGSMLVPVDEMPVADHDTIEVPRMATLVKLGQRFEEPILHHASRQSHSYMVFHDGLLYRFRLTLEETMAA